MSPEDKHLLNKAVLDRFKRASKDEPLFRPSPDVDTFMSKQSTQDGYRVCFIQDIVAGDKTGHSCLDCGKSLIPVALSSEKVSAHFRHEDGMPCAGGTSLLEALHSLSSQVLARLKSISAPKIHVSNKDLPGVEDVAFLDGVLRYTDGRGGTPLPGVLPEHIPDVFGVMESGETVLFRIISDDLGYCDNEQVEKGFDVLEMDVYGLISTRENESRFTKTTLIEALTRSAPRRWANSRVHASMEAALALRVKHEEAARKEAKRQEEAWDSVISNPILGASWCQKPDHPVLGVGLDYAGTNENLRLLCEGLKAASVSPDLLHDILQMPVPFLEGTLLHDALRYEGSKERIPELIGAI